MRGWGCSWRRGSIARDLVIWHGGGGGEGSRDGGTYVYVGGGEQAGLFLVAV